MRILKMYSFFILFSISLLITSCLPESIYKDVLIYNKVLYLNDYEQSLVIIDGDTVQVDTSGIFTNVLLEKGEHTIVSNGIFPEKILVTGDGILSSGRNQYVLYPVDYVEQGRNDGDNISLNITGPLLLGDTTVVYKSTEFESIDVLITRLKGMVEKSQNGDYTTLNKSIAKNDLMLTLKPVNGFIKKRWDYTSENIPDEITLGRNELVKTKSMVLPGDFISMYALFDESMSLETVTDEESLETIKAYIAMKHELLGY